MTLLTKQLRLIFNGARVVVESHSGNIQSTMTVVHNREGFIETNAPGVGGNGLKIPKHGDLAGSCRFMGEQCRIIEILPPASEVGRMEG